MFFLGELALKHAQCLTKNKSFICSYCDVLVTSGFHLTASCSCLLCCKESCVTIIWRKHAFSCSLKSWIKGSDTQPLGPWSIVEMKASGKLCESQRATARACTIWWSVATRPLIRHQSPLFLLCSGFKGNTGQSGKPHSQTLQFAKGHWEAGIHLCVAKTLSGILQEHVHVNKQAVGKVPQLSCSKRFHLWWVYIMIQMKIFRRKEFSSTQMDFWKCTYNGFWIGFMQIFMLFT